MKILVMKMQYFSRSTMSQYIVYLSNRRKCLCVCVCFDIFIFTKNNIFPKNFVLNLIAFCAHSCINLVLSTGKGRRILFPGLSTETVKKEKERKRERERGWERHDCRSPLIIHRTRTNARACFQRQTSLKIQTAGRKLLLISFTLICKLTFQ